ncbi:hypothetical protein C6A36_00580 [Desulfobacteraceae bacterium SEEP-SAG10]|nr:hypothetical protein C6A36_00580 [Desulfobacteraceae bacterium SEEP-SAG10]
MFLTVHRFFEILNSNGKDQLEHKFQASNSRHQIPNTNDLNYFDFSIIDENIFLIHLPFFKIIWIPIF